MFGPFASILLLFAMPTSHAAKKVHAGYPVDGCTKPTEFCVVKVTSSNACMIKPGPVVPGPSWPGQGNSMMFGPFNKQADATAAMCANYDRTMEDPSQCFDVVPANACPSAAKSADKKKSSAKMPCE